MQNFLKKLRTAQNTRNTACYKNHSNLQHHLLTPTIPPTKRVFPNSMSIFMKIENPLSIKDKG